MTAALLACAHAAASTDTPTPPDAARSTLDGPVAVRGQFPLMLQFLDVTPRTAYMTASPGLTFAIGLAYESTHAASDDLLELYADDEGATLGGLVTREVLESTAASSDSHRAYYVDGETARLTFDLAWSVSSRVELRASLPVLAHTGGFLDGPIESYHETFGFEDGGRPPFARDQYVVGLSEEGVTVFLEGAPGGAGFGDLLLETRLALSPAASPGWALTGTASIEVPTGDPDRLDGNGSLDAGLGLAASWRLRRWSLHTGAQYAWLGAWEPAPGLAPRNRLAGYLSGILLLGARSSLATGVVAGTGPFSRRPGGPLGETAIELSIGYRHLVGAAGAFEAALLENVLRDHNVPDVGFYLGWTQPIRFH